MENAPQGSTPSSTSSESSDRLLNLIAAVTEGVTVRHAIWKYFASNKEYYSQVSMHNKLLVRRIAQANVARQRQGELVGGRIAVTTFLERERYQAMVKRVDQLSEQRGFILPHTDYISALIAADLRTIDSN